MSTQAPPAARRCEAHNLATGPDGRCAVCRRGTQPIAAVQPSSTGPDALRWLLGAGLAVSLAGLAFLAFAPAARPDTLAIARASVQAAPAPAARATDTSPAKADPRADQAPQADQERQPDQDTPPAAAADPSEPNQQPTAAADASEQQRQVALEEQDRKRHEEVQRELKALDLAAARRDVKITMYSTGWCGVCARARAYMNAQNIPFAERDVEADPAARTEALALNPRGSVPTIAIDQEVLIGFSPGSLQAHIAHAAHRRLGDL